MNTENVLSVPHLYSAYSIYRRLFGGAYSSLDAAKFLQESFPCLRDGSARVLEIFSGRGEFLKSLNFITPVLCEYKTLDMYCDSDYRVDILSIDPGILGKFDLIILGCNSIGTTVTDVTGAVTNETVVRLLSLCKTLLLPCGSVYCNVSPAIDAPTQIGITQQLTPFKDSDVFADFGIVPAHGYTLKATVTSVHHTKKSNTFRIDVESIVTGNGIEKIMETESPLTMRVYAPSEVHSLCVSSGLTHVGGYSKSEENWFSYAEDNPEHFIFKSPAQLYDIDALPSLLNFIAPEPPSPVALIGGKLWTPQNKIYVRYGINSMCGHIQFGLPDMIPETIDVVRTSLYQDDPRYKLEDSDRNALHYFDSEYVCRVSMADYPIIKCHATLDAYLASLGAKNRSELKKYINWSCTPIVGEELERIVADYEAYYNQLNADGGDNGQPFWINFGRGLKEGLKLLAVHDGESVVGHTLYCSSNVNGLSVFHGYTDLKKGSMSTKGSTLANIMWAIDNGYDFVDIDGSTSDKTNPRLAYKHTLFNHIWTCNLYFHPSAEALMNEEFGGCLPQHTIVGR